VQRLGTITATTRTRISQKFGRLEQLIRAGIAVPEGWLTSTAAPFSGEQAATLERFLADGPVIVRGAFPREDGARRSAAGLSESIPGCSSVAEVSAAIDAIRARCRDRAVMAYFGAAPRAADVLIQRDVPRARLVVVAARPHDAPMIEVHGRSRDALAWGATPTFTGPLSAWENGAARELGALVQRVLAEVSGTHGVDVEAIVGIDGRPWIVQARPLTVDPFPHWTGMVAAMDEAGDEEGPRPRLDGLLLLDAEHNPEPLSVAHAWLIRTLAARRPDAGAPQVIAGWLYTKTLPRDLGQPTPLGRPVEGLRILREQLLPAARQRHEELASLLKGASSTGVLECLPLAVDGFLEMFDNYVEVLIPARRGFTRVHNCERPMSLRERGDFLDVLPAAWDLASPSFDELGIGAALARNDDGHARTSLDSGRAPSDDEVATLLGEIDDHYFALGLAPLRAVWLAAAEALYVPSELVFFLSGDELATQFRAPRDDLSLLEKLRARQHRHERRASLCPPERIFDGAPFPLSRPLHHGVPVGPSVEGILAVRHDLEDIWRRPPAPGEVIATRALTAQAAVALAESNVAAICTEHGGALSHGVLMARELGLSALIGCRGCTSIPSGSEVRIDTTRGVLELLVHADGTSFDSSRSK